MFGNIGGVRSKLGENAAGLPGTYKLGAWYNSLNFGDHRDNASGLSLADPANVAPAHALRNNFSVYAVTDQLVWKKLGTTDGAIGVFAWVMVAPPDRNLVDDFVQGGIRCKVPFAGRENDMVGLAASWAHISRNASRLDKDTIAFTGQALPVR